MEWTRDKTVALINEYRKRRGLWDMTHDDYRKKEVKQKLLMDVSACLGGDIPITEIEKKFHTLRTQYHREISRVKRKEPYNSKWFGFKALEFLSSPKACRTSKSRVKAEITEEGVVTKYIIRDYVAGENNGNGSNSSAAAMAYEVAAANAASNRSHELEKLIEETTKDVEEDDDVQDVKTKINEQGTYQNAAESIDGDEVEHIAEDNEPQPMQVTSSGSHMEPITIQSSDEMYQTAGAVSTHVQQHHAHSQQQHHIQQGITPRIIKIQRRETSPEEEFQHYQASPDDNAHSTQIHAKRIYYEAPPGTPQHHHHQHQHATAAILATPISSSAQHTLNSTQILTTSPGAKYSSIIAGHMAAPAPPTLSTQNNASSSMQLPSNGATATTASARDEFATYGEYVANEMRTLSSKEILIDLKHKINTALFEANMAQLRK